jgi:hypothetical protein
LLVGFLCVLALFNPRAAGMLRCKETRKSSVAHSSESYASAKKRGVSRHRALSR